MKNVSNPIVNNNNRDRRHPPRIPKSSVPKSGFTKSSRPTPACFRCGSTEHMADTCDKKNVKCFNCDKLGHISSVCQSPRQVDQRGSKYNKSTPQRGFEKHSTGKKISYVQQDSSSDDDWVLAINSTEDKLYPVSIDGTTVQVLIDSGSNVNILTRATFRKLPPKHLQPYRKNVFAFGSKEPLKINGHMRETVSAGSESVDANELCFIMFRDLQ